MDVDRLHAEIQDLTRRDWDKLPPECAAADGRRLAGKINQLVDWVGLGGALPAVWKFAQRMGPYAEPVTQELEMTGGIWACSDCQATLDLDGDVTYKAGGGPTGKARIKHNRACRAVRP